MSIRVTASLHLHQQSVICCAWVLRAVLSVTSEALQPNGPNPMEPARLLCTWDAARKSTGVVAMPSSRVFSRPRYLLHLLHHRQILYHWAIPQAHYLSLYLFYSCQSDIWKMVTQHSFIFCFASMREIKYIFISLYISWELFENVYCLFSVIIWAICHSYSEFFTLRILIHWRYTLQILFSPVFLIWI